MITTVVQSKTRYKPMRDHDYLFGKSFKYSVNIKMKFTFPNWTKWFKRKYNINFIYFSFYYFRFHIHRSRWKRPQQVHIQNCNSHSSNGKTFSNTYSNWSIWLLYFSDNCSNIQSNVQRFTHLSEHNKRFFFQNMN